VHERPPARVVVTHGEQRISPAAGQVLGKITQDGKIAVAVAGRGPKWPNLAGVDSALGYLADPGSVAQRAGVGPALAQGAQHFQLAGAGVAVLADVQVEAEQGAVLRRVHARFSDVM